MANQDATRFALVIRPFRATQNLLENIRQRTRSAYYSGHVLAIAETEILEQAGIEARPADSGPANVDADNGTPIRGNREFVEGLSKPPHIAGGLGGVVLPSVNENEHCYALRFFSIEFPIQILQLVDQVERMVNLLGVK